MGVEKIRGVGEFLIFGQGEGPQFDVSDDDGNDRDRLKSGVSGVKFDAKFVVVVNNAVSSFWALTVPNTTGRIDHGSEYKWGGNEA